MLTPEELKALLDQAVSDVATVQAANAELTTKVSTLLTAQDEAKTQLAAAQEADGTKAAELTSTISELQDEISDLRSKVKNPVAVIPADTKVIMRELVGKAAGSWLKSGKEKTSVADFFVHVKNFSVDHFKSVNITNPGEGAEAVANVLSGEIMDRAREYSPILAQVGRKPSMTRSFREEVNLTFPQPEKGIENVAGNQLALTPTGTYGEVISQVFKVSARPFITDEAMYGADLDLYGDLVNKLGREIGVYLAAQILQGDGTSKAARGILSQRIDIADGTGESWKPTFTPTGTGARDLDMYPVKSTGVDAALGADDDAITNLIIDLPNELPSEYLSGASYHMNRLTKGVLEKVKDNQGRPIFKTNYQEAGIRLNGYPVVIDDTLPIIASNSTPIIFGNLNRAYLINDGDIDKMILDPYTRDGGTTVKTDKEMFEMIGHNNAIIVVACTTNSGS